MPIIKKILTVRLFKLLAEEAAEKIDTPD